MEYLIFFNLFDDYFLENKKDVRAFGMKRNLYSDKSEVCFFCPDGQRDNIIAIFEDLNETFSVKMPVNYYFGLHGGPVSQNKLFHVTFLIARLRLM